MLLVFKPSFNQHLFIWRKTLPKVLFSKESTKKKRELNKPCQGIILVLPRVFSQIFRKISTKNMPIIARHFHEILLVKLNILFSAIFTWTYISCCHISPMLKQKLTSLHPLTPWVKPQAAPWQGVEASLRFCMFTSQPASVTSHSTIGRWPNLEAT